jgi:hypothetical protein
VIARVDSNHVKYGMTFLMSIGIYSLSHIVTIT